ncbi:hypothetical protein F5H01DRAFT_363527 [Linnemannia elongata]|nr:hypothetical protein F5H01DRAFT_363527 [Linnemannia elongata]
MFQVTAQYLKRVTPLKNDGVKVLSGEYRGALCILTAVDVYDGIVKLRGDNTYKVLAISILERSNMTSDKVRTPSHEHPQQQPRWTTLKFSNCKAANDTNKSRPCLTGGYHEGNIISPNHFELYVDLDETEEDTMVSCICHYPLLDVSLSECTDRTAQYESPEDDLTMARSINQ